MENNNYMTYTLKNLYKEILTLPEEKANQICAKAEQLLNSEYMPYTKFVKIVEEMINDGR